MSTTTAFGCLQKMRVSDTAPVTYTLLVGDAEIALNDLLGAQLTLRYSGQIFCGHCGRKTKTSFQQGYCYPCFQKLAACDSCIVSPEKCHYAAGTCREPEWAQTHCMRDHIVYLANSSGLKVGITRASQLPTRWIDQGAVQALPLLRVDNRLQSGLVEVMCKQYVADKTNWRRMLSGANGLLDMVAEGEKLAALIAEPLRELQDAHGLQAIQWLGDATPTTISYPVLHYPEKVTSLNFDKQAQIGGRLLGIKGQYLMLDTGVINIRKFSSYEIEFSAA